MRSFTRRVAALAGAVSVSGGLAVALLLVGAAPASAHVVTKVGKYQLTVGWNVEPTYSGVPNAVYLGVKDAATLQPVDDIGNNLKVVVSTGNQSSQPLEPELSFDSDTGLGSHGVYLAPIIPTSPGVYTFKFSGAINGQPINNLSFSSSDSTFNDVVDPTSVQFPVKIPTAAELSTNAQRSSARAEAAQSKASSAHDSASTATTLAIIALIVGGGLGIAGIVIGLRARRPSTS